MSIEYRGKRDPLFVAVHRGGLLDLTRHRLLANWAADCAEHVLSLFTAKYPDDDRPSRSIAVARAWSRGEDTVSEAREAAFASHSAAKSSTDAASREVARSAGHAAATAHMADHAMVAATYAIKAVRLAFMESDVETAVAVERQWQREHLPEAIRELVLTNLDMNWLILAD